MRQSKEELEKKLKDLKLRRQEVLEGVAGNSCEVYSRIV